MSENTTAGAEAEQGLPASFSIPAAEEPEVAPATQELPPIVLVAAGLTVFDAIVMVATMGLWVFQRELAVSVLPSVAGPVLLFGIIPIVVGGWIQHKGRKDGAELPGSHWGRWAIIAGAMLSTVTLLAPIAVVLRSLSGQP